MSDTTGAKKTKNESRRDLLKTGAATVVAAGLIGKVPQVHAAGDETLKVALVGCGGRGSGAAADAMRADPNVKLVAMADIFRDRLESSRAQLQKVAPEKFAVDDDHCFVGVDAYKQAIDSGVDVVLLATPPHFRPAQLKYAIEQGKHVFAEKPVAVDAPGVRSVLATCEEAKKKNLAVVSGLCWRYHPGMRATVQKVLDGDIGRIVSMQCNYNAGGLWHHPRRPEWSDMEWQLRNWLYFTWLSGDHNVEQHVHSLDKMAWCMGDQYPVKAFGLGGRQARTQSEFGHIFDHHAVCYEFEDGRRCYAYTRQQQGAAQDVSDWIFGTDGTASLISHVIEYTDPGKKKWKFRPEKGQKLNMYQQEHDELFASIRAGDPINNGDYMTKSTLMAIMGRMATYTGEVITWEQALNSEEDLTPPSYDLDSSVPVPAVAIPGVTKFV